MALKWNLKQVEVKTDSATVYNWVLAVLTKEKRVRTKGDSKLIVKRRLGVLEDLINEFDLQMNIVLVPTHENKADCLTRVKKSWLTRCDKSRVSNECCAASVQEVHDANHFGVERTLYLARMLDPTTSRKEVERIVKQCEQ